MGAEQIISNTEKSNNGVSYEKGIYDMLNMHSKIYGIQDVKYQQIEECSEEFKDCIRYELEKLKEKNISITEKRIKSIVKRCGKDLSQDMVIRTKQKFSKRSDTRCTTIKKYIDKNGINRNFEIIIDSTTSARGDRIKAKAQDARIYKENGIEALYIVLLPNNDFFDYGYDNPKREKKLCENECYNHNFANKYKKDGITLILQEDDFLDFLLYLKETKRRKMDNIINNFKKDQFPENIKRRQSDLEKLYETISDEIIDEYI